MRRRALFPLAAITALVLAEPGFSQEVRSRLDDTLSIEEVVVTGSRTRVSRNNVPLTVSVVSRDEIENSSESALLPVLSEQVAGLFVTERGITGFGVATGAAGQISLRGIGGSPNTQVLVLLNGNPQFMGIMGHPLPDAYIASDVEKVEIIHGPASTLYGTNAMGGVINIITKEQKGDGLRADARLMYGSFNTQKYMVNGGFRKKGFSLFASFNHDKTDGHRDSSDFRINNGYLRVGYEINRHLRVNGDLSLANFDATDPGPEGSPAGSSYDITRGIGAVVLDNDFDRTSGSLRFFYNFGEHDISDGFHSKDKNYGVVLYQAFRPFKGNTVTLGIDYKKYGGISENILAMNGNGMLFGDTTVREVAGYGFIQQELFGKVTLNAGFRMEHNSVFGNEPVPTGGIAYRPTATTTLKGSVAKGFRSPTIRELYLWAPANASLEPERMMNFELGILQRLFASRLSLELTFFSVNGDNLIQTVMGPGGPINENTGWFSNKGVEFSGSFRPTDAITLVANYSYTSMKEPVAAFPGQLVFVSGTYKLDRLAVNFSLQHIHDLYTRTTPEPDLTSYTLLNSRVSFRIIRYIDVFVKGENLTNRKYYINFGYPMPGIVVLGGVNLHIAGGISGHARSGHARPGTVDG
jgi:outer membrane cobalamin receptor